MKEHSQAELARRALDLYKDGALKKAFVGVDPTQMRTLYAAFEQAGSLDEQEIVLRYQAARLRDKWDPKLVEKLLALSREAGKAVGAGADESSQAQAAARQLGLIVRVHRVAHEESKAGDKKERAR